MASTFTSTTGLYAETKPTELDDYVAVTGMVYETFPDDAVEILSMLGLICDFTPTTKDASEEGEWCRRGRHQNIPENRYDPADRPGTRCRVCKQEDDRNKYRRRGRKA